MLSRPYTVLIIDDENDMCDYLVSVVDEQFGDELKIISCLSGQEAMEIVESEDVHIIITDLNMPGQSGYDICKQVTEKNRSVQVLFFTGDLSMSVAMTCFRDGVLALLNKPVDPGKLIKCVGMGLERLDYWAEVFQKYNKTKRRKTG